MTTRPADLGEAAPRQAGSFRGRGTRGLDVLILCLVLSAAFTPAAHAYVDPGSGAFFLQTVIAGLFGALFYFRQSLARIFALFRSRPRPPSSPESEADR
jgi:hypothetical protein